MEQREELETKRDACANEADKLDRMSEYSLDPDNKRKYAARAEKYREKEAGIKEQLHALDVKPTKQKPKSEQPKSTAPKAANKAAEKSEKTVANSGDSGIIDKKISFHISEFYVESETTYDYDKVDDILNSTFWGRDTQKYIESNGINIEIYFNYDSDGVSGSINGRSMSLYALYNDDEAELVSTIIHEVSHEKYNWHGTQEAEVNCYLIELMHQKNGIISNSQIQMIVDFVRKEYDYLPEGDLYGF